MPDTSPGANQAPASSAEGADDPSDWMRRDLISQALRARYRHQPSGSPRFVLGVSTFNRLDYLTRFVETFAATRASDIAWTLIVADDGSTDGTWEYLTRYEPDGFDLVTLRNHGARIAGQTNTIFTAARAIGFDFGFKADDDIFFDSAGWDHLYYKASTDSGFDHLVYYNPAWKPQQHLLRRPSLSSSTTALDSMGCFFTFTPRLLDTVGVFDEVNFPIRGHSHIDFTMRATRAGFNDAETLWDAEGSTDLVFMWERDGYVDLTNWRSPEIVALTSPEEKERRLAVINSPDRIRVTEAEAVTRTGRVALVARGPNQSENQLALEASGRFWTPGPVNVDYDEIFVLNLADDQRKWAATASQLASKGISFQRFPAVFGGDLTHLRDWRYYQAEGLFRKVEVMLGRKLIQSPGAWGYLKSTQKMLEEAKSGRLRNLILFDDDVRLHVEFNARYAAVRNQLKGVASLLFLGCTQREWTEVEFLSDNLYRADQYLDGSFAVGIAGALFDELLESIGEFTVPFDSGALRSAIRAHSEDSVVAFPNLVIPDVEHSYIRESRDIEEHAATARWNLEDYEDREAAVPRRLASEELITVVVPALDAPATDLVDTIDSIVGQTYGKLQVFVGVSDNGPSASIAEGLPAKDPRLAVFLFDGDTDEPTATNAMLSTAVGDSVAVVQAGTICSPTRFEDALRDLNDRPAVGRSLTSICIARPAGKGELIHDFDGWIDVFGEQSVAAVDLVPRLLIDSVGGVRFGGEEGLIELVERGAAIAEVEVVDGEVPRSLKARSLVPAPDAEPWDDFKELLVAGSVPPYVPLRSTSTRYSMIVAGDSG